jgi:hypothetical protein
METKHVLECGYNCHSACSELVIQCRPQRRWSPDSLSVTDSEAESISKYSVHSQQQRASFDRHFDDNNSINSSNSRKPRLLDNNDLPRSVSSSKLLDESVLKSPTFSGTKNNNKAYRKSLKQQLQHQQQQHGDVIMSPHATAKAFTRLVARSRAFFYIGKFIHDIYSWKNNNSSLFICLLWMCSCRVYI